MKKEDITEENRYYLHAGDTTAHVVFDTFMKGNVSQSHHIYTFCKSTYDYGSDARGTTWGPKEKVLVEGVTLCETCEKSFQEAQEKGIRRSNDSVGKGIDLLREVPKDKKEN